MNIEDLKIDNEYHVVTYTVWDIHVVVTPQGYTKLSDQLDEYECGDVIEALDSLNADFQTLLQLQEDKQ